MKIVVTSDYAEMSVKAAQIIKDLIVAKPDCVLGLATGSSPEGTYANLVSDCAAGKVDFSKVRSVNLDEYVGLGPESDQSYYYFMHKHLFDKVNIDATKTNLPNGLNLDDVAECARYNAVIDSMGGIDLQLLGIGPDGHIGFNEPADVFPSRTHKVALTESTIEANKRFFASADEVPRFAYTMGVADIMRARKVLMVVSGASKADIVKEAFEGPITPRIPASILQVHPDFTLVGDAAALSKLTCK